MRNTIFEDKNTGRHNTVIFDFKKAVTEDDNKYRTEDGHPGILF